jgi:hypothetical protein
MTNESYWNSMEEAYDSVSIYDGLDVFLSDYSKQPLWVGDLLATHWILSEVSNGGLMQFFLNSTGVLAPEAKVGFQRMGLPDIAAIIVEAMAYFGSAYPRDSNVRNEFLANQAGYGADDEDWKPFEASPFAELEEQLYRLGGDDLGKIYDVMDAYAATHAA